MPGKRMGVLLDRDGVIAEQVHHLHRKDELRLIPGAAQAIRALNDLFLPVVIITNQAVVARGLCTEAELDEIHSELRRKLKDQGAEVDAVYFCPHHENASLPQYRRACPDRKPGPGMFLKAAADFDLDLSRSFAVGDRTVDIMAGRDAGCRTILVRTGYAGEDRICNVSPDFTVADISEAVGVITSYARSYLTATRLFGAEQIIKNSGLCPRSEVQSS